MATIWAYCRISIGKKQKIGRQVKSIKRNFPNAIMVKDEATGTNFNRKNWNNLLKKIKEGDTIVFDEISRMSRDADEGFKMYQELYINQKINLVFLKEPALNTENLKKTAQIALTGGEVDVILKAINKYLLILTENQIKSAFEKAQSEVDYLHVRTREGLQVAREKGKVLGHPIGVKNKESNDKKELKDKILKYNRAFNGPMTDKDFISTFKISHNTFYKYKKELRETTI